jgi:tetratricopeptide (TPR) repeat protein
LNQHVEAQEAVAPIVQAAIDLGDQRNLSGIYTVLGSFYGYVKEDYPAGVRYLEEGNRISRATGNFFYDWLSSYFLGAFLYWYGGEFEKGLEYFRRSLALSEAARSPSSVAFVKGTMSSSIFIFRGRLEEAYRESKEAVFLAEESGDIHTIGMAYACHGSASYFRGFFEEAEKAFSRAIESCRKTGQKNWEAWSTGWLGVMYLDLGKYPRSLEYLQNTISIGAHERYFPSWYNMNKLCLERARVLNQDRDINLAELPARYLENNRMKIIEGTIARYIGEIFLNVDDRHLDEADGWVRKSLELDLKNSTLWSLAGDYALRAELLKRRGDLPGSRESLGKALEVFRECGADGWVSKYENELAGFG